MDEFSNEMPQRPRNPRRRTRTKMQNFKEAYLPVIIAAVALILIIVLIVGSAIRNKAVKDAKLAEEKAQQALFEAQTKEAGEILVKVNTLVADYDYAGAVSLIDSFSGKIDDFPTLSQKRAECETARLSMVAWDDPSKVLNLSFHMLIADLSKALQDVYYSSTYGTDFVTTEEFSKILTELYNNGYVLVSIDDIVEFDLDNDQKTTCTAKTLYLPEGKKPLILTQTGVYFNNYMVDSDEDLVPDQGGSGFASKLMVTSDGSFTCQMVNGEGQTVTGNYDLVSILEDFIQTHEGFSYRGARAIIGLSGYDGVFGYRTESSARNVLGAEAYDQEVVDAKTVADALREKGYEIACYTYDNIAYEYYSSTEIQADINKWNAEVVPIVGRTDILVMAKNTDLSSYTDGRAELLQDAGFRYFLGFCDGSGSWAELNGTYFHQGRYLVSASNLGDHPQWFSGAIQSNAVLDLSRSAGE